MTALITAKLERGLGLASDSVALKKHSPQWREAYREEADRIVKAIKSGGVRGPVRDAHIGSTAIPKIEAKAIIDIALGFASMDDLRAVVAQRRSLGLRLVPHLSGPYGVLLRRGEPTKFYVHCLVYRSQSWRDLLLFRNTLRKYPATARAYERLKQQLAREHPDDRVSYSREKGPFVERVLARARLVQRRRAQCLRADRQRASVQAGLSAFGFPEPTS